MVKELRFMIIKQQVNRGYTLIESLVVLLIISMSMLLCLPFMNMDMSLYRFEDWMKSELVCLQMNAIQSHTTKQVNVSMNHVQLVHRREGSFEGTSFTVNAFARVSKALTLVVGQRLRVKIWLGMGKIDCD